MPNSTTATLAAPTEITDETFDAVEYARSLVGRIRDLRRETERQAKIPDELVEGDAGRGLVFDGDSSRVWRFADEHCDLDGSQHRNRAREDAGVAWAMTLINGCNWMAAACYPKHVSDEVFFETEHACCRRIFTPGVQKHIA